MKKSNHSKRYERVDWFAEQGNDPNVSQEERYTPRPQNKSFLTYVYHIFDIITSIFRFLVGCFCFLAKRAFVRLFVWICCIGLILLFMAMGASPLHLFSRYRNLVGGSKSVEEMPSSAQSTTPIYPLTDSVISAEAIPSSPSQDLEFFTKSLEYLLDQNNEYSTQSVSSTQNDILDQMVKNIKDIIDNESNLQINYPSLVSNDPDHNDKLNDIWMDRLQLSYRESDDSLYTTSFFNTIYKVGTNDYSPLCEFQNIVSSKLTRANNNLPLHTLRELPIGWSSWSGNPISLWATEGNVIYAVETAGSLCGGGSIAAGRWRLEIAATNNLGIAATNNLGIAATYRRVNTQTLKYYEHIIQMHRQTQRSRF